MTHQERFNPDQFTVPAAFPEILKDLNREVLRAQPKDIYQFCATYFHKKLADQRSKLINLASGRPADAPNAAVSGGMDVDDDPTLHSDKQSSHHNHHHNHKPTDETEASKSAAKNGTSGDPFASSTSDSTNQVNSSTNNLDNDDDDMLSDSDDDDDEADDVLPDPAPAPPASHNRGRRTSVSAESMAPTTDAEYVKVVIPKSDEQRERIQASIKNNFLFRSCDEEQYADVVNAMAEKRVAAGEEVIRQGGVGDYFYVVETGTLDVFVSRNGAEPARVTDYGSGGSFGELALMYNAPRAATVIATSECVLWALDRVTFRRILMENTSRKRRMYESFLEDLSLLSSLEAYERHKIADALESQVFNDGEIVIKQGDVGENFYLIESGEATVSKVDEHGAEHELPGLTKGQYFGELALLTNEPRKATIRAKGKLKVATLGKKAFVRLLGPVVDILKRNTAHYEQYTGLGV